MKNILIAVTGASPQVLTETVFALYKQGKPIPSEVYVITTRSSKETLEQGLFIQGHWHKLIKDYHLPTIEFSSDHIWVISDDQGHALEDAKGESDQSVMADFITRKIAKLTDDPHVAIHASIAGGRKTMAFYMGYAMSLYGREQDVLSHVFVDDEFEFVPDFYYPTPSDEFIVGKQEGVMLNAKVANVTLAEIPFVRMRKQLEKNLIPVVKESSFSKTVARMNAATQAIDLKVSMKSRSIHVLGVDIKLSAKLLAMYVFILEQPNRKMKVGSAFIKSTSHSIRYLEIFDSLGGDVRVYTTFGLEDYIAWSTRELDRLKPISTSFIQTNLSGLHKKLFAALPEEVFEQIKVYSDGAKGGSTYHVKENLQVTFVD